jgi:hypothetical protein
MNLTVIDGEYIAVDFSQLIKKLRDDCFSIILLCEQSKLLILTNESHDKGKFKTLA